jgi:F0F1-type ATP synthase membrane subunit a
LKNPKTLAIAIGALVLLAVGFLFVRGPKPIIEIKAEKLADIGPFPLVNTYVTSTLVVIVIATIAFFATRHLSLIPRGLQNVVEAIADALYTICINTAGEANAKRFFWVIATIFTFIWIANWMALLPFFNAIGGVTKVDAHHFHHEAQVLEKAGGISFIRPNVKEIEFVIHEGDTERDPEVVVEEECEGLTEEAHHECEEGILALSIAQTLEDKEDVHTDVDGCPPLHGEEPDDANGPEGEARMASLGNGEGAEEQEPPPGEEPKRDATDEEHEAWECYIAASEAGIDMFAADGKTLGVIIPYFRSMNTDINSPLSIAIMAMIFIEFWGITALGVFKYGAKFFNFSSPINFIVGILEFVAEIARLISFTFRLFGNMLAGEILLLVMTFLAPFLVAIPFYGLETFVGVIQAFVFAMLTLVFATLAVSSHEGHDEPGGHDDPDRPLEGPVPVPHG